MSHKKFPPQFICPQGGCPEPPQVIIKHSTSIKMRQAQMLKKYGFFTPSNTIYSINKFVIINNNFWIEMLN